MSAPSPVVAGPDRRRAAHGTFFALLAVLIEKGGAMAMVLVLARVLGIEGFGRYAALMSWVALFQVGAELGQEPVLVRLLAQDRSAARGALVEGAMALRLALALTAGTLLVALGTVAFPAFGAPALAFGAAGLVAGSGLTLRALFRTVHRLEWLCVTALASLAGFAGVVVLAVRAFALGVSGAVAAWAVGQLVASGAALWCARALLAPRPRWDTHVAGRLARAGLPLALNAFLLTATLRVGQLIVLRAEGATAVGYLAAGSRLAEGFAVIPEAVMLVLLPVLAGAEGAARDVQRAVSVRAARYLGLLALPVIIVVSVAAPALLGVLYGPAYTAGAPALRVLAWLALLAATGAVFTNLLIARGRERLLLAVNALGSALTLGLSLMLVPRAGFVGAAVATLAASLLCQVVLVVHPETRDDAVACLRPLLGPVALALALTFGGSLVGGSPALVAGAALGVFAIGVVATGSVGRRDWAVLRRAVGGA